MRKSLVTLGVLLGLVGCGDPLAGVPRLAEVDIAENDPAAQALPTEDEIAREGFFGTDAARADVASGVPEAVASEPPPSRTGGLLGLFRRTTQPPASVPAADPSPSEAAALTLTTDPAENPAAQADAAITSAKPEAQAVPAPRRGGFLGLFRRADPVTEAADESEGAVAPAAQEAEVAALSEAADARPEPRRKGLLSGLLQPSAGASGAASDLPEVSFGTILPYGVLARNCSAKRQSLGRKVDGATGGYKLYDSNPRATGLRTFYITGFDDGCPRQLTAAHVLLGAPSFYELLHYGPAGAHLAVGDTDRAYEKVKARVCGVRKGKPCGSKINRLERSTVFVNAYPRTDDNTSWSEMLIHQGDVVATASKSSS